VARKQLRVYLSGGMEYAHREGINWRSALQRWVEQKLGHRVFNPNAESERFLAKHLPKGSFRALKSKNPNRFVHLVRRIVDLDSRAIAYHSDYLICYWDHSAMRGAGTKGELTLARFFRKPVYMVTRMNQVNIPAWVLGCTTKMFRSFDELKHFLLKQYALPRGHQQ
jgi:hypothetical protein